MALQPGDIKIVPPMPEVLTGDGQRSYKAFKVFFMVRDSGPYSVEVPVNGFTPELAQAAIIDKAKVICETLDLFK